MADITTPQTAAAWRHRVLWLAVPIILSNITVPLVGIVDTAVMGRMDTPAYLSATAIAATLFSSIFWVFGFLRMGTSGLVAQALGAENQQRASRTALRSMVLAVLFGLVLLLIGPFLFRAGMWTMNVSDQVHALASAYFTIRMCSAPATLMLYSIIGVLVAQQRMRAVLATQLLLNLTNVALTLLFFTYTDWHIRGVAAATVLSEYLAMAFGLYLLWSPLRIRTVFNRSTPIAWLWDRQKLVEFFLIGGDLFVRTLCLTTAFYWLTVKSASLGILVLAVNAVLIQMLHFMAHALDGFSHAAETLAGHAYGKRDRVAIRSAVKAATFWALIMALMFTVVYALFGGTIFNLFTTQIEVQKAARQWLWWIAITPLVGVWSFLLDGIFIGTTHTREMRNGMMISLTVFILATMLLVPLYGNDGLWMSYCVLMLSRALTLGYWFPAILKF